MEMMLPEAVVQTSARQAALVWSPHPLLASEGRVIAFDAPTGAESLHDYLIRLGVDLSGPVIVSVDRAVIPREWLTRVRPKPGTLITVRAAVAGGGDGSQVVAIVAMIAISVMAPYLAGAAYGLVGGTIVPYASVGIWAANTAVGMALTTGITIAGSLAVSALMPKPKVDLGKAMSSAKSSATYSLSGGSNQPRPYEPLGLTLGRHRVFFDLASRPYSTMVGKESYLSQVFHVGMHGAHGPVRVEDLRIGDTPLTDYQDVEVEFSYDEMPQLVAYNVDTAAGSAITVAGGPLLRTTSVDTTRIEVDLQALLFYTGDSGIQERAVTLRAEYRPVAGGAWMPFAVEYQVGYYTHYWSHGSFESYDGAESGGVSTYYVQDSFDANRSPAAHVDGVGGWYWRQYSKIYSDPSPPSYELVLAAEFTLYNSGTSPVHRTYSINVPKGQYEIRISRVSPDETNQRATSEVSVTSIKSFQNQDGNFVGQCFMAVKVRASGQLNGTLATLSGVVSQPVGAGNYSSIAADVYLLFARGYRVGGRLIWGAGLGDDELDLPAIAAWRAWCVTKNLTFNAQIDSNKSVWDILQAIARCGRGSPSWGTGKLGVLWDAEGQPVIALFGPANIKRGTFEISYNSGVAADEVLLNFVNAAKNYDADFVRLSAPGVVSPIKPASVELWGCTDMDMAVRDCRLQVAYQTYRTRSVTWLTDMEGLVVTRGDVVALSHDLTQWGVSGRLVGGTATVLQLDRAITLDPVANWITVVQPDGEMITSRIQYLAGEHDTVTLLDALPVAPDSDNPMDWRYLADYQPTPGKRVKIVDIQPASMHEVRITAMDDPDEYYAAEAGAYSPPAVRKWTADAPTVSGLQFSEELVRAGSGYAVILTVGWSETGDIAARGVRYSINGGALQSVAVDGPECRLTIPDTGTVTVTVNAYTAAGQSSTAATRTAIHTIVGQDIPPPNVSGFAVSTLADGTRAFVWTVAPVAADVTYIEIRYATSSGTAWGSMTPLGRIPYASSRAESSLPAAGTWTFEARLLDDGSNYSAAGARVTATLGAAPSAPVSGVNRIYNSSRIASAGNDDGWQTWTNRPAGFGGSAPDGAESGAGSVDWSLPGRQSRFTRLIGVVPGRVADWSSGGQSMPVTPGMRLEAHALLGAHRCSGHILILFLNSTGEQHSTVVVGTILESDAKIGGKTLSAWKKTGGFADVPMVLGGTTPSLPASAVFIRRQEQTNAGNADSYLFCDQAYLGEALPGQTVLSPWSDGARTVTNTSQLTDGAGFGAAATAAQEAANTANSKHADLASDYKLTPVEKQSAKSEWVEVVANYGGIDGQAAGFSIVSERTSHSDWYGWLSGYLSPYLVDLTTTSDIDGPTWRYYWSSYYAARQTLLNKIAAVAATTATWSGVAGNGKPLDNAGRVLDLGTGTVAGQRQANDAPGWYAVGTAQQFKWSASVGLPFGEWGVLRTERAYGDDAAPVIQTWKSEQGQWARKGYLSGWSAWGRIWDRTLDASNVSFFVSDNTFGYRELASGAATGIGELGLPSLSTNFYYRRPLTLTYTPATTCTGIVSFTCEASPMVLGMDIEIYVSSQTGLPPDNASTSGTWTIAQVDAFKAGAVPGMLRRAKVTNGEFGTISMEATVGLFAGQVMDWGVMVYQAGGSVSGYTLKNMRIKIEELRS